MNFEDKRTNLSSEVLHGFIAGVIKDIPGYEDIVKSEVSATELWNEVEIELSKVGYNLGVETKILEVGSGNGTLLKVLLNRGLDVIGMDAKPRADMSLPMVQARIERLPFKDSQFDMVCASAVFDGGIYDHHQKDMIVEIARVLKSGGMYVSLDNSIRTEMGAFNQILKEKGSNHLSLFVKK